VYKKTHDRDLHPPHPGEILREDILPLLRLNRSEFARHLGVSARVLSELLSERRSVTLDLAQRLGAALGQGARYWLGLQMQHDVWQVIQNECAMVKPLDWGKADERRANQHDTAYA
jgi:addiction module HigA family antidote